MFFRDLSHPLPLLILLLVVLLLFGAKRLPDLTRSVGKSMRILKTEVKGLREDDDDSSSTPDTPKGATEASSAAAPRPIEGRDVDAARREERRDEHHHSA